MIYYDSGSRPIEFTPEKEAIGFGRQGAVYDFGVDKCIKIYTEDASRYEPEIFELFKELSLDGYCKLYDLLYSDPKKQEVAAYIMKKYVNEVENILNMPTDYTIDSFNTLYNSVRILAHNRIIARDTIAANAILSNDGVILIDFDSCNRTTLLEDHVLEININNILYLFKGLFKEGLKKMGKKIEDEELSNYLNHIFAYSKEPVKALKRRMAYSNTPMDVLPYKYRY